MQAWVFTDGVAPETYRVGVNPNTGGTSGIEKTLTTLTTPAGNPIVFEGRDKPRTFSIQGVILEQGHLEAFESWYNKNYQVKVVDDLDREFWVYITSFQADRKPTRNRPYRHTFSMDYTEVNWT